MKVEFLVGSQEHFVNHVAPIYLALPEEIRGNFHVRMSNEAHRRANTLGIPVHRIRQFRPEEIVVVAGQEDYRATGKARTVYYNHGVGQTYAGDVKSAKLSSYSGGKDRDRAILFLCPSESDAQVNREAYPGTPAIAIGVPYLDQFSSLNRPIDGPVVFSFHANILACPETRWSWPWIKREMVRISHNQPQPWTLLGHCHPRARRAIGPWFKLAGIPYEPDWMKVLAQARCYVIDNSSSGYEAAALGIPTVWLNPPWYRKDVHHSLRFWETIPGPQVDDPSQLESAINLSLQSVAKPDTRAYRGPNDESLVDGNATQRAVDAICLTVGYSRSQSPSLANSSLV